MLWFGRPDAEDCANVEHIRGHSSVAGLVWSVFVLLTLWWFLRQVLTPARAVMQCTRQLAEGSTDAQLVAPGAVPELQAFAKAFNDDLDRIDDLTHELQSANDLLAHELRTPLARIRDNLESFYDQTTNAAFRGLEEIDRATDLVQTILATRREHHAGPCASRTTKHASSCRTQGRVFPHPISPKSGSATAAAAPPPPTHQAWAWASPLSVPSRMPTTEAPAAITAMKAAQSSGLNCQQATR